MTLVDELNLDLAFRRLEQDKRDDVWPDVVGFRDYRFELQENLQILARKISQPRRYQTCRPRRIETPKRDYTLRPGLYLMVEDRLLYQALADLLAPHFKPEPCVYSNRLSKKSNSVRMFEPGVELWLEFQDQIESLCSQYAWVVETDITAYFDHINHDLLAHRITDLFGDTFDHTILSEVTTLLKRLWERWCTFPRFGIPQVNDASSFFGNLYLDELDKWAIREGYKFLRYVDDIRIFVDDEPSARKALADLIVKMREMGLYVASGKTSIKRSEAVLRELEVGRKRVSEIETELDSGTRERIEKGVSLLEKYFVELVENQDTFNDRHFRYCVNRFKRLKASNLGTNMHDRVITEVLSRLTTMPHATDIFIDYLSMFGNNQTIQQSVLDFLKSPYNIYPWQQMLFLELLIRLDLTSSLAADALAVSRDMASSPHVHPAPRTKALIIWGKSGDYADRRAIRARYSDELGEDIRRAIVVAIQEMQISERDNFYRNITNDSRFINATCQYIRSLSEPTYHYFRPPSGYDVSGLYEDPPDSDDLEDLSSEHFSQ